jgi:hypothetical protein
MSRAMQCGVACGVQYNETGGWMNLTETDHGQLLRLRTTSPFRTERPCICRQWELGLLFPEQISHFFSGEW